VRVLLLALHGARARVEDGLSSEVVRNAYGNVREVAPAGSRFGQRAIALSCSCAR
jgi:hypothetical protein